MSDKWEEAIQQWYTSSHTSKLDYLDLAETINPTRKELAHNISVVYDRTCLSSRVSLKNFKLILEKLRDLEIEVKRVGDSNKILTKLFLESGPLSKQEIHDLVIKVARQPKIAEKEAQRLSQDLDRKLQRVEHLLSKIEKQIFG